MFVVVVVVFTRSLLPSLQWHSSFFMYDFCLFGVSVLHFSLQTFPFEKLMIEKGQNESRNRLSLWELLFINIRNNIEKSLFQTKKKWWKQGKNKKIAFDSICFLQQKTKQMYLMKKESLKMENNFNKISYSSSFSVSSFIWALLPAGKTMKPLPFILNSMNTFNFHSNQNYSLHSNFFLNRKQSNWKMVENCKFSLMHWTIENIQSDTKRYRKKFNEK